MKNLILFVSITISAGLLSTNIYNSVVDAKSWGNDIPASIQTTRDYFKIVHPGIFFRVFSPANQVFALFALIVFWKTSPAIRLYLGIAFVLYVFNDVLTFAYFYPRNEIMMKTPLADVQKIQKAWMEWSEVNWIRSMICLVGLAFSFLSLHKIYGLK